MRGGIGWTCTRKRATIRGKGKAWTNFGPLGNNKGYRYET
jgi:hypothetical protein